MSIINPLIEPCENPVRHGHFCATCWTGSSEYVREVVDVTEGQAPGPRALGRLLVLAPSMAALWAAVITLHAVGQLEAAQLDVFIQHATNEAQRRFWLEAQDVIKGPGTMEPVH